MDRPENHPRSRLIDRAVGEARRFAVMFFYLWVLFGLFVLNERIILGKQGISFSSHGFAIINAFVLAKVMLTFEHLNIGRFVTRGPLIYKIFYDLFCCLSYLSAFTSLSMPYWVLSTEKACKPAFRP